MYKNAVSLRAYLKNETEVTLLDIASPQMAIDYLSPDTGVPVQTLSLDIFDRDGKQFHVSIFPGGIEVREIAVQVL